MVILVLVACVLLITVLQCIPSRSWPNFANHLFYNIVPLIKQTHMTGRSLWEKLLFCFYVSTVCLVFEKYMNAAFFLQRTSGLGNPPFKTMAELIPFLKNGSWHFISTYDARYVRTYTAVSFVEGGVKQVDF